jgi:uncharacterized protein YjdB
MKRYLIFIILVSAFLLECKKEENTKVTSIKFNLDSITIKLEDSIQLSVIHSPSELKAPLYKWSSSNSQVVSVTDKGLVKGHRIGIAAITASTTDGKLKAITNITVLPIGIKSVKLNKNNVVLVIGDTTHLIATVMPSNVEDKTIKWTTSDSSIVSIDNGIIKGISIGVATITVNTSEEYFKATCSVKVVPIPVSEIFILESRLTFDSTSTSYATIDLNILLNEIYTLHAVVKPDNADNKSFSWSSQDPNIALVDENGNVKGMNFGTTKIIAKTEDGGHTGTLTVNVVPIVDKILFNQGSFSGNINWNNCLYTGEATGTIYNNSPYPIKLTKFEVIDTISGNVAYSITNDSTLGILEPNQKKELCGEFKDVYKPIFKCYFILEGDVYFKKFRVYGLLVEPSCQ